MTWSWPPVTFDAHRLRDRAAEHMRERWLELRDDAGVGPMDAAKGAIVALAETGLLTVEQRELWERRILTCPGHDDEAGRRWCAYCGDMPPGDSR